MQRPMDSGEVTLKSKKADKIGRHRFCVAPMMEWTDRHCRFFHRLLTRRALLYTEMLTTGAVLHGDRARLLRFDPAEHPLALQLGGSEPRALAACARIGAELGFDEINLNAGCPSDRVQDGRFGACLMAEPALVGDCVAAMKAAVSIPVTVKCRIGIDEQDPEEALEIFAQRSNRRGADALIVHARKAWLKGLSPKENREVPPLDYARVYRLKAAHPQLTVVLNGGVAGVEQAPAHLQHVDGVMMGRAAYQEPWRLIAVDPLVFGADAPFASPKQAAAALLPYIEREIAQRHAAARHHATSARLVPRRARRARFPPPSRRRRRLPRKPAPNSSPQRSRWLRDQGLDSQRGIGAHRRVTQAVTPGKAAKNDFRRSARASCSGSRWPSSSAASLPDCSPACSASAAARSSCRCSTRCFAFSTCPRRCACSFASALRLRSSCRPRSAPISRTAPRGWSCRGVMRLWALPAVLGVACGAAIAYFRAGCRVQDRLRGDRRLSSRRNFCSPAIAGISAPICPAPCRCGSTASSSGSPAR